MSGASSSRPLWSAIFEGYKDIDQADQEALQGIIARFNFPQAPKKRVKTGDFSVFTLFLAWTGACPRWGVTSPEGGSFRGGLIAE